VLTPSRAVPLQGTSVLGWWTVDPTSGYVNDEMEWGGHQAGAENAEEEGEAAEEEEPARRFSNNVCRMIAYSAFALAALAGAKSGNPLDIVDAVNKGAGLVKKEDECKQKQKRPKGGKLKTPGSAPKPPKPPKPPRRPPGPPPKSRPPAPDRKIPPPQGKDRWGWGPKSPSRWPGIR
jgi:hypothetical protein